MAESNEIPGMGWLRDYPDFRDYTMDANVVSNRLKLSGETNSIKVMLTKVGVAKPQKAGLPASVDLRAWCSPVEDQKNLGSCTANAGVGVVEYFERRAFGNHIDASRLFLYKATRNLLGWTGDTGAFLRSTMAALVLFGVPPESYWPYDVHEFRYGADELPVCFRPKLPCDQLLPARSSWNFACRVASQYQDLPGSGLTVDIRFHRL